MTVALWEWGELVTASGGHPDGVATRAITGFSIDTRSLAAGDVFVALKDVRDGHEFVTAAFAKGAAAALVSNAYVRKSGDGALIGVADPLEGLRSIARASRARLAPDARVIAITGSAGKTGTTAMLRACLAPLGVTHAPEKSFNNHWGVPLTLARMPAATRYGVFEIGMNHAGEIEPLTRLVRPHIAIITNVLPVHVGNFADGEAGVAKAKAEIFLGLEPGGVAIIPRDTPHFDTLKRAAEAATNQAPRTFRLDYNADEPADSCLIASGLDYEGATIANHVAAKVHGRRFDYDLGVAGQHIATNSLAVLLCLDALGKLNASTLDPLLEIEPPAGRGARTQFDTPSGPVLLIDEGYNANPASMKAAIDVANWSVRGRFRTAVVVVGDMLELGVESAKHHTSLAELIGDPGSRNISKVFACGPMMKLMFDALPPDRRGAWAPTSTDLIPAVLAALRPGDVVMVKGSLGSRMAPIVDAIKKHFAGHSADG